MASLESLIDSFGQAGFARADVATRAKYLRRSGLLPAGPRGRGAPQMDSTAAARLVLAILANTSQTTSAQAVQRLSMMEPRPAELPAYYRRDFPDWTPPPLFTADLLGSLAQLLDWWRLPDPTLSGAPSWSEAFHGLTVTWANGTPVAIIELMLNPAHTWGAGPNRLLTVHQQFAEPGAQIVGAGGVWFSATAHKEVFLVIAQALGQLQPALPLSDQKAEAADPGPGQPLHQPSPLSTAGKKLARQQSQSSPPLPPSQAERESGGLPDPLEDEKWPLSNSPMQAAS